MSMDSDEKDLNNIKEQTVESNEDDSKQDVTEESELDAEVLEDKEFEEIKEDGDKNQQTDEILRRIKNENSRLADENKKLSNEIETLKDRLMRTSAEYENFRKRTAKEKEGIYTDACEDVLKNMLPVLDNLERALTANGSVDDLKKGIEMTIRQFNDSLGKLQVEEIATDGEFDPNLHNAVMHMDDEAYGKNAIVEVFQKGYKRGNKVLRHSMVKVAN